jgi:hypothetical protein
MHTLFMLKLNDADDTEILRTTEDEAPFMSSWLDFPSTVVLPGPGPGIHSVASRPPRTARSGLPDQVRQ